MKIEFSAQVIRSENDSLGPLGDLQDPEQSRLFLNGKKCLGPDILFTKDSPSREIAGLMDFSVSGLTKDWKQGLVFEFIYGEPGRDSYTSCPICTVNEDLVHQYPNLREIAWIQKGLDELNMTNNNKLSGSKLPGSRMSSNSSSGNGYSISSNNSSV